MVPTILRKLLKVALWATLIWGTELYAQSQGYPFSIASGLGQTVLNVKPGGNGGDVLGWNFTNTGNATCWVQFFNAAAANVTLGSTAPYFAIPIQATNTNLYVTGFRITFPTGMSVASATTATGSSACNANPTGVIFFH